MPREPHSPEDVRQNRKTSIRARSRTSRKASRKGPESFLGFSLTPPRWSSDADSFEASPGVTLITLAQHQRLELRSRFPDGMEEGMCPQWPNKKKKSSRIKGVEEDAASCTWADPRPPNIRYLLTAAPRSPTGASFGNDMQLRASPTSRFLAENSRAPLVDTVRGSWPKSARTRRYEPGSEYSYSQEEFFLRPVRGHRIPPFPVTRPLPGSPGTISRPSARLGANAIRLPRPARSPPQFFWHRGTHLGSRRR